MIKLKSLLQDWISHAPTINRSPDSQLRPTPGGQNEYNPNWNRDVEDWNSIVEGDDWFVYKESNDWEKKVSGASVTITEDNKPSHKIWIKIKTHGLRKPNDTNESFKERIRKHTDKITGQWVAAAKKIHDNTELNEVGNPVVVSWKQSFKEALKDPRIQSYIKETGEKEISPVSDPVNFTPRI